LVSFVMMREIWWMASVALAPLVVSAESQASPGAEVVVGAVRSYRAEHRRTQVDAFVQVPYALLQPSTGAPGGALSYRLSVRVTDSTGLTLLQESWQNHAIAEADRPDAYTVEMIRFSLAPGHYHLDVGVEDSVSGHRASSGIDLEGFASTPAASDLLLSPRMRLVTATDTVPQPAELRWGNILVTAAARLQLTPLRPRAFYLLEAYCTQVESGTLEMRVADSAGKVVVRAAPAQVQVPNGGGVLRGELDLTGLPPGHYTMIASLKLADESIERDAPLVMAGLGETLAKDVARREVERGTDQGYFEAMNDAELAAAKEPLVTIAEYGELAPWDKSLSLGAKRRFLAQFWEKRDPTPTTPRNEAREGFYDKVAFADKTYREAGRKTTKGWRTDRGRIYIRNGPPDDVLQRGSSGGAPRLQAKALPYEVWRYTRQGKDRWYIFMDRNGLGAFQLVHSNDLKEPGLPNWNEFLGQDQMEEIGRFLGIEIYQSGRVF
jgi:GWxTD domain-containing protein